MSDRGKWIALAALTAAFILAAAGCGGAKTGAGGTGGATSAAPVVSGPLVSIQGTVTTDDGSPLSPVRMLGPSVGFNNALVRAFDYATGLEYLFLPPDYPTPPRTGSGGTYNVKVPKGRDYILSFERALSSGGTARISAVAPDAFQNQTVDANLYTSAVAEAIGLTMGSARNLSETWVGNVNSSLAAITADGSYMSLPRFTIGGVNAMIGNSIGTGLLPINGTIQSAQDNVGNLIAALPRPPPTPTGLSINVGNAQNTISWTAADNAVSYNIYIGPDNTVSRRSTDNVIGRLTTSYVHSSLTNGQRYFYVVTAVNTGGESAESDVVSGMPQAATAGAPASIIAIAGNRNVSLSWGTVAGAASYSIYWGTSPGVTTSSSKIAGHTATFYAHTGLSAWTTVYYRVAAVNGAGAEGALSAEASATPNDGTIVPTLADAKAVTADLRDTVQSLVNYRNEGVAASNGVIDNAAANLKTEIDNVVVPYFDSFGTSMGSFIDPTFRAVGGYPAGGDFIWNSGGNLSYAGPRTDGEWRIHTFNGLDIRLWKAYSGSLLVTPINFDVTSGYDSGLSYNGTFSNITVDSTYRMLTAATVSAAFSNSVTGTGTTQRVNASGNLWATLNGSGDITAFSMTGNFSSPYLSGSGTLSLTGQILNAEYNALITDNTTPVNTSSTASQVTFTNGTLLTRKGALAGNLRVDLVASGIREEEFDINDGVGNRSDLRIYWDVRGGARILSYLGIGWDGLVFGYGSRWITDPPTGAGDSWTINLHGYNNPGEYTRYVFTINRTNPAAPTISGTINKHLWLGGAFIDSSTPFTGSFKGGKSFIPYPRYVNFYGRYTNADPSVHFSFIEGSITGTYINWSVSDPFFINKTEAFTSTNFPQVRLQFYGTVSTAARPAITGSIDWQSSYSAAGTAGNPDPGFAYMKIAGTTNYRDGIESINGTATTYFRHVPMSTNPGQVDIKLEKSIINLMNARNVSFDFVTSHNFTTGVDGFAGSVYYHPPTGSDTIFGTMGLMNGIPRITWSDTTFESLP